MNNNSRAVYVGCCDFRGKREPYFARLSAVELGQTFYNPPKDAALNRLRKPAPEGFAFIIKAFQLITHEPGSPGYRRLPGSLDGPMDHYGHFRATKEVERAVDRTMHAADLLQAHGVLFETPASFTPTAAHRRRLTDFFERLPRDGRMIIWDPRGLWSAQEHQGVCRDLDLLPCWDPLATETFPSGEMAFCKVQGMGSRHPLSESDLLWLADGFTAYERVFCIFNSGAMLTDACKLAELLPGSGSLP